MTLLTCKLSQKVVPKIVSCSYKLTGDICPSTHPLICPQPPWDMKSSLWNLQAPVLVQTPLLKLPTEGVTSYFTPLKQSKTQLALFL